MFQELILEKLLCPIDKRDKIVFYKITPDLQDQDQDVDVDVE